MSVAILGNNLTLKIQEIKNFLLNGMYAYLLFGFYSLTLSPFITKFIVFGEKSYLIAILGFSIYIAEFFAFNFKLKMIRMRVEEKRIAWRKKTGVDVIPRISFLVWFGFFGRIGTRLIIIMASMTALGYVCTEKEMSTQGSIVILLSLFIDISGLFYIYINSGLLSDPPQTQQEADEQKQEESKWDKKNLPLEYSFNYFSKELISDFFLQVYAFMLYTGIWYQINQIGLGMLNDSIKNKVSATSAVMTLFPMLFCMVIVGLLPVRIAYWIEDSTMAFTPKERRGMWGIFLLVAIFTCAPCITKFISLFILK